MTIQQTDHALDADVVERLSREFNRCFETFDADPDAFADDVFFDLYPPYWRFQVVGREAGANQLRAVADGAEVSVRVIQTIPTPSGFVTIHEETSHGEKVEVARRMCLCEVRDGRIAEVAVFCNGGWDDELRARHAAEAPMVRP